MKKRFLSVIVFSAAFFSLQAQERQTQLLR